MKEKGMPISLEGSTSVICENCGNNTFEERFMIQEISKFLAGTPKNVLYPIPVFACSKCSHINDSMNPLIQMKLTGDDKDPV